MLTHLRTNAVAYLALFIAIGGTSYAAVQLPKDSVSAKQIAKNAVRTAEVKDGSLKSTDFAAGTLLSGPAGPAGPAGSAGPTGPAGPTWAADRGLSVPGPVAPADLNDIWTFTVPSAGKLFVYGRANLANDVVCDSSTVSFGLYIDGVGIPGTSQTFVQGAVVELATQGVTGPIAAGQHTISASAVCGDGTSSSVFFVGLPTVGAVLVGS